MVRPATTDQSTASLPERAVRRDIPLISSIRRAFAAGTRDSTGRPGRNYWQLWMDYGINARLDPVTSTITGREIATIHNNSDSTIQSVVLRLDQNISAPKAARLSTPLEFYSKLLMPYAFPQLTFVDGPEGGMEFPMFLMSGAGAADHEAGHQWWPMMVGVNETWYPFMDEGFNQYVNIFSEADWNQVPARLDGLGQSYGRISGSEQEPTLMWNANYGGPLYSFQAYQKAPMMLAALGGIVGDSAVQRAMSEYTKAWRYKHPSPWDFAFFMNDALKQDLGWFWHYWLFTTESVDASIRQVATSGHRTTVTVRQDGQMPSPVVLRVDLAPTGPPVRPMSNSRMLDTRTALVTYPVDVWFEGSRTFQANLDFGGRAIEKITLDPEGRFPDRDSRDNIWPRASAPTAGQERR